MAIPYVQSIDLNDFQLLNFVVHSSGSAPTNSSGLGGMMWWDSSNSLLKVYDDGDPGWRNLIKGPTGPITANNIPQWDSDEDKLTAGLTLATTVGTPGVDTALVTEQGIREAISSALAGGVTYKGGYNANTNSPDLESGTGVLTGDMYTVTADGNFFTEAVQTGDVLIAIVDDADSLAEWTIVERNIAQGFLSLTDTPAAYTGSAGYMVMVNSTPDELEFVDPSGYSLSNFNNNLANLTDAANGGLADFTYNGASAATLALDFTNLTDGGTLAATDEFAFYDASATAMRALSYTNLLAALNTDLSFGDGDVSWGTEAGLQPLVIGANGGDIDGSSVLSVNAGTGLFEFDSAAALDARFVMQRNSVDRLVFTAGDTVTSIVSDVDLIMYPDLVGGQIGIGQARANNTFLTIQDSNTIPLTKIAAILDSSGSEVANFNEDGSIYFPELGSDDTEDYVIAIDDTTGLLTKRSVSSITGTTYTFQHSITETTGTVNLVGDVASPGNTKLYGTNGSGVRGWYDQPAGLGTHNLLDGNTHPDTVAATVSRGSIIVGNATPLWDELVLGAATTFLKSDGTDAAWATINFADLGTTPTTLSGYGISDTKANFNTALSDGTFAFAGGAFHDGFSDFVANEHINHTSVSISTGVTSGLSGGGDISATRNLVLDVSALTAVTSVVDVDEFAVYVDGTGQRKITWADMKTELAGEINLADLTAGSGLSGGTYDGSSAITFALDINSLSVASIAGGDFVPFWDLTATADNKKITFSNFEATLNHDNLAGFVANEHIDHSTITLTAGSGLSGGGDITANRTFDLDINGLAAETTIANGDFLPFWDITATATNKKITFTNFMTAVEAALDTAGFATVVAGDLGTGATPTITHNLNLTEFTDILVQIWRQSDSKLVGVEITTVTKDTVTVNFGSAAINPAAGTYRYVVTGIQE